MKTYTKDPNGGGILPVVTEQYPQWGKALSSNLGYYNVGWYEIFTVPRGSISSTYGQFCFFEAIIPFGGDDYRWASRYKVTFYLCGAGVSNTSLLDMIKLTFIDGTYKSADEQLAVTIDDNGLYHFAIYKNTIQQSPFIQISTPMSYGTNVLRGGSYSYPMGKLNQVTYVYSYLGPTLPDTYTWRKYIPS